MTFKKTEKEILKAIVKYGDSEDSLAAVLHKSKLLEKRGIAIIHDCNMNYVFLRKDIYDDWFSNSAYGYIEELRSLVDTLIKNKDIVMIPYCSSSSKIIGGENFHGIKFDTYSVNGNERICLSGNFTNWFDAAGNQKYWPCRYTEQELPLSHFFNYSFSVSEELRELVKHDFKSEEQRRFDKQQRLMWISIAVAIILGLLSFLLRG